MKVSHLNTSTIDVRAEWVREEHVTSGAVTDVRDAQLQSLSGLQHTATSRARGQPRDNCMQ